VIVDCVDKPVPLEAKDHPIPQLMTSGDWKEAEPAIIAADKREGLAHRISEGEKHDR
jgi:hypothetical protein